MRQPRERERECVYVCVCVKVGSDGCMRPHRGVPPAEGHRIEQVCDPKRQRFFDCKHSLRWTDDDNEMQMSSHSALFFFAPLSLLENRYSLVFAFNTLSAPRGIETA